MVEATVAALRRRGVEADLLSRDSRLLERSLAARAGAFFSGIYSFAAARAMRELLARRRPDFIHVHNLHPQFSPSVIVESHRAGVPVVMTCHNYRLVCPGGMHMQAGRICERCLGGHEYWCLLKNCKENLFESAGYALRNAVHRRLGLYRDRVSLFIAVSQFVRGRLIEAGLPADRIVAIPNMAPIPEEPDPATTEAGEGDYIGFAGRFSPQKGIGTLLEAARLTGLPVRLAGNAAAMPELARAAPQNVRFLGPLDPPAMAAFYRAARLVVVPSQCLEPFGLVAAEAMGHGRPVLAARIGGLTEIVEDGVTGMLFEPGDADELAVAMERLWADPALCRRMGQAGRARAASEFSEEKYVERLLAAYNQAAATPAPSKPPKPQWREDENSWGLNKG